MNKKFSILLCLILMCSIITGCSSKESTTVKLDPQNPTTVTIWNYYNGDQLTAFESLVDQFNSTVGIEKGIVVVAVSQGSVDNLVTELFNAVEQKVGADDVPSAASVYAESAYILNEQDAIVGLDSYFTQEELDAYVPSFIDEGRLTENGDFYLVPVSKSTEAFIVNTTDWAPFEEATGIAPSSITSIEDLVDAAQKYYEYTDGLTPDVKNDGKALYGRDSVSNYMVVGPKQLGHPIFTVLDDGTVKKDFDKDTFRRLWDNFYVPFVKGYFGAGATYRSEDMKTGAILSMTGSTSGISYIPTTVTDTTDISHDVTIEISKQLGFKDAEEVYVQQGAGYCVMKTDEAQEYATVEFLKWFTNVDQNMEFSISSGYSPVTKEANNQDKIKESFKVDSIKSENMLNALLVSADVYTTAETYTSKAFKGGKEAREILSNILTDICVADRASVVEAMNNGATLEEATAPYLTDEYFDTWFNGLVEKVNSVVE